MSTRTTLLLTSMLLTGGLAMAQTDDTPPTGSAEPELEGYESMESVETENGDIEPEIAPTVSDDTPPTGSAEPELEGYESMESVEIDQ